MSRHSKERIVNGCIWAIGQKTWRQDRTTIRHVMTVGSFSTICTAYKWCPENRILKRKRKYRVQTTSETLVILQRQYICVYESEEDTYFERVSRKAMETNEEDCQKRNTFKMDCLKRMLKSKLMQNK